MVKGGRCLLLATIIGLFSFITAQKAGCSSDEIKLYEPYGDNGATKYYACFSRNGEPVELECPENYTFNKKTLSCTVELSATVDMKCKKAEDKFADTSDDECKKFYKCVEGGNSNAGRALELSESGCDDGEIFNSLIRECVEDGQFFCGNKVPECIAGGDDKKYPYNKDCGRFYECTNDVLSLRKCPQAYYFDYHSQACLINKDNICEVPSEESGSIDMPDLKEICKGNVGQFVPDPLYCMGYYYCLDAATPYWSYCLDGKYFDNGRCTTTRPNTCTCEGLDFDEKEIIKNPTADPTKYYVCEKGKLGAMKTCPAGTVFDTTLEFCVETY